MTITSPKFILGLTWQKTFELEFQNLRILVSKNVFLEGAKKIFFALPKCRTFWTSNFFVISHKVVNTYYR